LTTSEYHEVDRLFLKSVITIVSILFIVLIFLLGRGELICLSIVSTFWLPAKRGGPRSTIVVISALCGLAYFLLAYVEDSMPLTYSVPTITYWGYCKGVSAPVHYTINYRCLDDDHPIPAETEWYIQTMKNYPALNTFFIILPYELPCVAAALVAYSLSKKWSLTKFQKWGRIKWSS
jgi:hypothetical protein